MAIIERRVDDLDQETDAEHTDVLLSFNGRTVKLDLNAKNFTALEKALNKYLEAGSTTQLMAPQKRAPRGSGSSSNPSPQRSKALREARTWLQENGHQVGDKGKIPEAMVETYVEATGNVIPE